MPVVSIPRLAEFGQFSKMASEKNEKVLLKIPATWIILDAPATQDRPSPREDEAG
jgi:hypothetical protein